MICLKNLKDPAKKVADLVKEVKEKYELLKKHIQSFIVQKMKVEVLPIIREKK